MSAHTPGPWGIVRHPKPAQVKSILSVGFTANGMASIAWLTGGAIHQDANARLIAAAPDLLAALRALVEAQPNYPSGGYVERYVMRAKAAIAKAEGK